MREKVTISWLEVGMRISFVLSCMLGRTGVRRRDFQLFSELGDEPPNLKDNDGRDRKHAPDE